MPEIYVLGRIRVLAIIVPCRNVIVVMREQIRRGKANTELSLCVSQAVMARSKEDKRKGTSRLVYAIPLVALVLIAAVYAASVLPASSSPAAIVFACCYGFYCQASDRAGKQQWDLAALLRSQLSCRGGWGNLGYSSV